MKKVSLSSLLIASVLTCLMVSCSSNKKKQAPEEITVTGMRASAVSTRKPSIPVAAPAPAYAIVAPTVSNEKYQPFAETPIKATRKDPISTFSIDVDTGSYSNVRRFLKIGELPPTDAVRIEELINYFPYSNDSLEKINEHPFGVQTEVAPAPWNSEHQLLRIRIQAVEKKINALPPANLVFLVDVSGSMSEELPLVKSSLKMLSKRLRAQDRISLVVYAGRTQIELEPTHGDQHEKILAAIDKLDAAGSTAGESAIKLAYQLARSSYIPEGINRILMATDGDFNVGVSDIDQLKDMVETERKSGISLTTLGFGTGNYNDYLMEQLADIGNGNYSYIDSADEGRKVLVEEMASTLNTVASDVKVQMEFNPEKIAEYRLLGYENRALAEEDFKNDKVDAGEIGAGKTVTALYELTPIGKKTLLEPSRYTKANDSHVQESASLNDELGYLRIRYKKLGENQSTLLQQPILMSTIKTHINQTSNDFRFAASVAGFGLMLRDSKYLNGYRFDDLTSLAQSGLGEDQEGYRAEFVRMIKTAKELSSGTNNSD